MFHKFHNLFDTTESCEKYFERISIEEITFPDGSKRNIRPKTLQMWLGAYRKDGFDGLKPKQRNDKGRSRTLTNDQKAVIFNLKSERPKRTATSIYKQCVKEGLILQKDVSLSTVQRYIAQIKPKIGALTTEDMRAFEMEFTNDLWQIDTSYGPYLNINGVKTRVYIIMIIDDASRMIVGNDIFTADNGVNVQKVIKDAILKFGVPKNIYTDNGRPYRNEQLELICARLGIGLKRTQVFHGNQKGKIERAFKSVKEGWMHDLNYNDFNSTELLNCSLSKFVQAKNQSVHRSLSITPWQRYLKDQNLIKRIDATIVENAFLHTVERKVGNDGTIHLEKRLFETSQEYIGRRVTIKYQPDLSQVYLYEDDSFLLIKEVNKVDNSRTKRNQPLLSKMEDAA